MKVGLPSEDDQRAIAHILGSLDDKIELNRQMNRTLEAMAQAIFKSWFVDFDPVRAKAEGRDSGLPKDIADLFPDSFEDSGLGKIPKGWEIQPISSLLHINPRLKLSRRCRKVYRYEILTYVRFLSFRCYQETFQKRIKISAR
jgi:type I restriction enzyme S subunit